MNTGVPWASPIVSPVLKHCSNTLYSYLEGRDRGPLRVSLNIFASYNVPQDCSTRLPRHPLTPGEPGILVSRGAQGDREPSGTVSTLGSRRDDVPRRAKAGPCDGTRPAGVPGCARLSCWPGVPPRCRRGPGRPCPPSAPPWRRRGSSSTGDPGEPGAA